MNFFNQLRIGARLGSAFAIVLALLAIMSITAILQAGRLRDNALRYEAEVTPSFKTIHEIDQLFRDSRRYESQYLLLHDAKMQQDFEKKIQESRSKIDALLKSYQSLVGNEEDGRLYKTTKELIASYWKLQDKLVENAKKTNGDLAQLAALGDALLTGESRQNYTDIKNTMTDWWKANEKIAADMTEESHARYNNAVWTLSLLGVVAVALGILSAFIITRSITRPLDEAVEATERVAQGDLTGSIEVKSQDETGRLMQALSNMNQNLATTLEQVFMAVETIHTASNEIATGNADLSSRTEQQAGSLEETASAMEELTATVKQNADNARQANQLVISASDVASKGGNVVDQVVTTMGSIKESSSKIVDIIGVIDGIAFQTNILALNAAVEAARAGEQGRGFAVVASEVRSLAQRSASAAKEIKVLIDNSVEKVEHGSNLVDQAGITMTEIVSSVQHVADIMGEITAASQEQSIGIEEVNRAISQMDEMTQQNAALVEQASAAAESLKEQAGTLSTAVGTFTLSRTTQRRSTTTTHKPTMKAVTKAPAIAAKKPAPAMKKLAAAPAKPAAAANPPKEKPTVKPAPATKPAAKPAPQKYADNDDGWEEF